MTENINLTDALKKYFGFDTFKGNQEAIIRNLLAGNDTFVLMLSLIHILILFVVDVVNGVTDLDMAVASILRRTKNPVIMVANKTDNNELQYLSLIHI